MPTYDYRCTSCGYTGEIFHGITEKPLKKCPDCGHRSLERLIGAGAGIIFKGSGFYETDYRSRSYQEGAKKEKEATSTKEPSKKSDKKDKKVGKSKEMKAAG